MDATLQKLLHLYGPVDLVAIVVLLSGWAGIGYWIEHSGKRPSTHALVAHYRARWMTEMIKRDNRIMDTNILATLRQGASFFTSASMIGVGGLIALLGQADTLQSLAADLSTDFAAPRVVWETKLILVLLVLASAFLKFVWSHRLFAYCAIVIAATPIDPDDPDAVRYADKAAKLNIYAARSFNRGLRAMYFALAALTWLLGAWVMIFTTLVTLSMLYRREFSSQSRAALLDI